MKKIILFSILVFTIISQQSKAQNLYFPPLNPNGNWDTISPASLGWCANEIDSLYAYLQQENTKGFMVLKDGKIVLEKYFGTFTQDSVWYWASAGKTITAFLVGKAQEENYLNSTDTTAKYLGTGWTNCTLAQEQKIKIQNQLTMTSGLDDGVADVHCTIDTCLLYLADAGTRWAYHNAPYTLLERVLDSATGIPINNYTTQKLKNLTGITGTWTMIDYNNIFFSKVRSMARFGLLAQNKFVWNTTALLNDSVYVNQMTNTSQSLNLSYGYLWWLNGKSNYMLPGTQFIFPGAYAPNAPSDMFAGIGKNGQIVSVSRSKGLVVVRMGNSANSGEVSLALVDNIWQKLNAVMCNIATFDEVITNQKSLSIYPNPANDFITINGQATTNFEVQILNSLGETLTTNQNQKSIDITQLKPGLYFVMVNDGGLYTTQKIIKQ